MGDPRATYRRFDIQIWRDKLQAELRASGLPGAVQKLTKEMVDRARINALLSEADTIIGQLREISNVQEYVLFRLYVACVRLSHSFRRKLFEARRTKDDYNSAKRGYNQAREQFQAALDTWNQEEHMQIQENRMLLEKVSIMISQKAYGFIGQAIERTLHDWGYGDIQSDDGDLGRGPQGAFASNKGVSVLEYPDLTRYTQQVAYRVSRYWP